MLNFFKKKTERADLFFKTDIHCHIIPGVDDGSPDVQTSAELVERMASWGLKRIIATPHVTQDTFENTPDILDPALEELNAELKRLNIDIDVSRSAEYRIDDYFKKQLDRGIITPFPNNFILVENSFLQEPWELDRFLYELKLQGYRPILAHPERYIYYSKYQPERYEQIYRSGTFLQVNLLSLAGYYGKDEKKTAEKLIENGYVDFIGTDLHKHHHADKIDEYLTTKSYRRLAEWAKLKNDKVFN